MNRSRRFLPGITLTSMALLAFASASPRIALARPGSDAAPRAETPPVEDPDDNIGHVRHKHARNPKHPRRVDDSRFTTNRTSQVKLPLPHEEDAFFFVAFGDRTGGPVEGVSVLADAVRDVNLLEPDLVMTVGDLIEGYNQEPKWMDQMREYKAIMSHLICPWFPVAGNHDIYWRGPMNQRPRGEHMANYEMHFGPLWYAFEHKNCWFIAIFSDEGDPATDARSISNPECQKMSPEQFEWLEETLVKAKGADHVFLFLHHPRWLGGNYGDDWDKVHRALVDAGNVSAVFAGHIHHARYDPKDGIEYLTLATVGGGQSGRVPSAGYLHHFDVVTVRKNQIALASIPVGQVQDVREITGTMEQECVALVEDGVTLDGVIDLEPDGYGRGLIKATIKNTTSRSIDVTVTPQSGDSRWVASPDHNHKRIGAGGSHVFEFDIGRMHASMDEAFRTLAIDVQMEYLAPGCRYAMPLVSLPVVMKAELSAPKTPAAEMVLDFDGHDDYMPVAADKIAIPDGPLTLECWFRADGYGRRTGLIAKTEGSEYGIFVNRGHPEFSVLLEKKYVVADSSDVDLPVNEWVHIAGVYDGKQVRVYVNGRMVATAEGEGERRMNRLPLMIGADVDGQGRPVSFFDGQIDEVRLSTVARYTGDRFEPQRRLVSDSDTALLMHMDGKVGPWLYDDSPRGAHSSPQGGARLAEAK